MTAYGPPATPRSPSSPAQRATLLAYAAGGLGVLSFIWGFLKWLTEGEGDGKTQYGGYALAAPGVAVIALSLAAGLLAAGAAWENKPVTITPVALAVTSVLLAIGILIGKGSISAGGGGGAKVGIGIGLILELITAIVQAGVLVFAWMEASGRLPANRAPAWPPQQQQQQPYPGQPGGYGPPQTYGQAQPPPAQQPPPPQQPPPGQPGQPGPQQGYGPPPGGPGYGPPPTH